MQDIQSQELVELVVKCRYEADEARKEQTAIESPFPRARGSLLENPWPIYQEFYEGKHWLRMGKMPSWKSCPVDNRCFAITEGMTTFITDNRGKAMFIPTEVDDEDFANTIQATYNWWCGNSGYDENRTLAVLDSRKFGVGWRYLKYDKEAPMRQSICVVPAESVLVDPDYTAADFLAGRDPEYLIYEYLANQGDLRTTFKGVDFDDGFDPKWMPSSGIGFMDRIKRWVGWNTTIENPALMVPVFELWIRDGSVEFQDHIVGDSIAKTMKKKYPGGRRIVVAGGKVLLDEANPYKHGQFPFTPILAYPESHKFYCAGDIQNIIGPQVMLNRMHQLNFDGTVKAGGGVALVSPRDGLTADMMSNDPFQVIEVKDVGKALRFEQFPAPPRHLFQQIDVLSRVVDDAAGMHDISRGAYTPGNKTAQEIAALTESDKTRVRKAARVAEESDRRIASQWLSNAAQWNDWSVFVRVSGDPDRGEQDGLVQMTGDQLRQTDEDGKLTDEMLAFDVTVAGTSTLPTYFQEKKQMALDLFDRQVIDPEALLSVLEFPGWRAIIQRMKAAQEGAAQAEAAMAPEEMPVEGMPAEMPVDDQIPFDPTFDEEERPLSPEEMAIIETLMPEIAGGGL